MSAAKSLALSSSVVKDGKRLLRCWSSGVTDCLRMSTQSRGCGRVQDNNQSHSCVPVHISSEMAELTGPVVLEMRG